MYDGWIIMMLTTLLIEKGLLHHKSGYNAVKASKESDWECLFVHSH